MLLQIDFIRPEEGYRKCPEFWDKEYAQKYARLWQTMQPETAVEAAILENGVGLFAICDEKEGQKYSGNGNAMLEVYSPGYMQSPDYECGIWVTICKRVGQNEQEVAEIVSTMTITGIL